MVEVALKQAPLVRLDFGCGQHKREGFEGVDQSDFPGVDHVLDLTVFPYPWADESVDEAHCSHFLEHLPSLTRVGFVNELYRILKPGASCAIVVPHWASGRAYGDPTHQWPPVCEMWFFYLNQAWRDSNAPHTDVARLAGGFACDFDFQCGYAVHPQLTVRAQEFQQFAMTFYKEAAQDIVGTLTKAIRPKFDKE
jgi:SAM-dependent methyltransferase